MVSPQLRPVNLASMPTAKCSLGCDVLDHFFSGGIPTGSITEFVGESTAAKSQLCMQLLLHVQLPVEYGGLEGSAVHPPEALADMPDPLSNIYIEKGFDRGQDVLSCLHRIRQLLQRPGPRPVRLIVIDSIAHVFRDVGDKPGVSELAGRTEILFRLSAMLRRYAYDHELAVVVTNQVMDAVGSGPAQPAPGPAAKHVGHTGGMRLLSSGREVIPALGLAWANCINTRVLLARYGSAESGGSAVYCGEPSKAAQLAAAAGAGRGQADGPPPLRRMQVVWSPSLAVSECLYVVEQTGLRGLLPRDFVDLPDHQNPYWHPQQQQQQQPVLQVHASGGPSSTFQGQSAAQGSSDAQHSGHQGDSIEPASAVIREQQP
ncbi:hypothetical protein N2152v2_007622 [Parachlorella kessleri]